MSKLRLFIIRHAERVDFALDTYDEQWINECFDQEGNYCRKNINMPKVIPNRSGGPQAFIKDSPLTEIGITQAKLTGEAMKEAGIILSHVYSSPALRCLQTSSYILKALNKEDLEIQIEPGLFELMSWYKNLRPKWMTAKEFKDFGINVNLNCVPIIEENKIHQTESCEKYYQRSQTVTQAIIYKHKEEDGNILMVGHAATLETCTRQLTKGSPGDANDIRRACDVVPYCGVVVCEESSDGIWSLIQPPFPTLIHSANRSFNWRNIQTL